MKERTEQKNIYNYDTFPSAARKGEISVGPILHLKLIYIPQKLIQVPLVSRQIICLSD